ncbi:MAG: hypothetical protein HYT27_01415 [Parcubacteria group bacterium]|nr:hypothetical protein [Parcubacteria group bacterium]
MGAGVGPRLHGANILAKALTENAKNAKSSKKPARNRKHAVICICQKWEESERGWGTRPDGYSLHLTDEDREQYIKDYWKQMPNEVPDEYSRPDGTPYSCLINTKTYRQIKKSKNGIRLFSEDYPGSGGVDGWVSMQYGFGKK